MSLVDYGRILVRRGWILVLLAVIAAGSAYFLSSQQTPIYRATQRMLIVPSRTDFGLQQAASQLLMNQVAYLNSSLIAVQVIDELQLDIQPEFLMSRVTIAPDQNSLVIQIDVDLEDQSMANDVARTWGTILVEYRNEQNQQARQEDRIYARQQDTTQLSLLSPRPTINAIVGAVLGILVGAVIIFVLEYLESSIIHKREDIERALELPVLASMPDIADAR